MKEICNKLIAWFVNSELFWISNISIDYSILE